MNIYKLVKTSKTRKNIVRGDQGQIQQDYMWIRLSEYLIQDTYFFIKKKITFFHKIV